MPKKDTRILKYQLENKYLKDQLILVKNRIKEIEYIVDNIYENLNNTDNNQIHEQILTPGISSSKLISNNKNKKSTRKHPEHDMYKYVISSDNI